MGFEETLQALITTCSAAVIRQTFPLYLRVSPFSRHTLSHMCNPVKEKLSWSLWETLEVLFLPTPPSSTERSAKTGCRSKKPATISSPETAVRRTDKRARHSLRTFVLHSMPGKLDVAVLYTLVAKAEEL